MLGYAIVVSTALLALAGAPWWSALVGGCALSLISIWEQEKLRARFAAVGASDMLTVSALASLATACMATSAAFALGRVVGMILLSL